MSELDVLIVGAGCFGLSTALHLKRRGVQSVKLLDKCDFPSVDAASNCSSRGVRPDYTDPFYARLGREAIHAWRNDQTFMGAYHHVGRLGASVQGDNNAAHVKTVLESLSVSGVEQLTPSAVRERFPGLDGPMTGFDLVFNPEAGWMHAREALIAAMKEYKSLDGDLVTGEDGEVIELIYEPANPREICTGVRTRSGRVYQARQVLLTAGAYTPGLVCLGTQVHPTGFAVAHWRLNNSECLRWQDHPFVDLHHHGYFFPPDETGLMKMGVGIAAYNNQTGMGKSPRVSCPISNAANPRQGIPQEAENNIRWILQQMAPSLAQKSFFDTKVCWDGMTSDGDWLITKHPSIGNLYIATGGAGHGAKFLPIIGKYIIDLLDDRLENEFVMKWNWRTGDPDPQVAFQMRPIRDLSLSLQAKWNEKAQL